MAWSHAQFMGVTRTLSESPTDTALRLGWIPYWNLFPLKSELESHGNLKISKSGSPALINQLLSQGELDLAPSSSISLLRRPGHEIAFPLGVAVDGRVDSVYIGLHHCHNDLYQYICERIEQSAEAFRALHQKWRGHQGKAAQQFIREMHQNCSWKAPVDIHLTQASETSVALTKILCRTWFRHTSFHIGEQEISANNIDSNERIELLIGDEALIRKSSFAKVIDLGATWKQITAMPFVFAVWQKTGAKIDPKLANLFLQCAKRAEAKMSVDPTTYIADRTHKDVFGHRIDLATYWKRIRYSLNATDLKGLSIFLHMANALMTPSDQERNIARLRLWESKTL